jgi:CHAT domain-containing protein
MQYSLIETPSILLRGQHQEGNNSLLASLDHSLIVGASIGAGESDPLPEVLNEARAVAQFEKNPYLLLARDATTTQVLPRLASATVIHFAGHAAEYNGETRLLLAPSSTSGANSYLDSSSFLHSPPRAARLIVFSACSTGKREEGWNHDMGDIVDTLAYLGVPDVVATRWKIDSASAVPMMNSFYGGLARGLTVPQSLTLARQALIRDTRYSHPYYWATYYASGVGNSDVHEEIHGEVR